ncbi:MAG TPA: hypothetical protein VGI30_03975 [Caulobacteraceae bacterium]|jgi:hypothetical protein
MKVLTTTGLAALAALVAWPALAQYAPDPYDSPALGADTYQENPQYQPDQYQAPATNNVQSYRDYRSALSAYDAARNTAARQRDVYNQDSADYRANRRAYDRRVRQYDRARDAYDAEFGPGAYEVYYGPPPLPPWD